MIGERATTQDTDLDNVDLYDIFVIFCIYWRHPASGPDIRLECILGPLPGVTLHVAQAQIIRLEHSHRVSPVKGIAHIPGVFLQELRGLAEGKSGVGTGPA